MHMRCLGFVGAATEKRFPQERQDRGDGEDRHHHCGQIGGAAQQLFALFVEMDDLFQQQLFGEEPQCGRDARHRHAGDHGHRGDQGSPRASPASWRRSRVPVAWSTMPAIIKSGAL
jgi:hypothetical protein